MRMEEGVAGTGKKRAVRPPVRRASPPTKRPKNLSLDAEAVSRGEEYAKRHGIALSRLVGDFLRALPLTAPERELTPAVERLRGVAAEGRTTGDDYREHLHRKYGGR